MTWHTERLYKGVDSERDFALAVSTGLEHGHNRFAVSGTTSAQIRGFVYFPEHDMASHSIQSAAWSVIANALALPRDSGMLVEWPVFPLGEPEEPRTKLLYSVRARDGLWKRILMSTTEMNPASA